MAKQHSPETVAQVRTLREQGLSYPKIAKAVGISPHTVRYMCDPKLRQAQTAQSKKVRLADPAKHNQYCKNYQRAGGKAVAAKRWKKNYEHNPGFDRLKKLRRSGHAPSWLTDEQLEEMRLIYLEARDKGLEVDHVHPLNGETVCGLHVPWNLQLLSKAENCKKGRDMVG